MRGEQKGREIIVVGPTANPDRNRCGHSKSRGSEPEECGKEGDVHKIIKFFANAAIPQPLLPIVAQGPG